MGNVLIEETSLDSVGDAIREQLDVSTKYKVSEMPDAIRSISGGGGGTTNYNNLSNKPQINSVTLEGNKSLSDLSIQETLTFDSTPTDGSTNPVTSDGIYDAFAGVDTALSGKVDTTSVGVANGIAELDNDGLVPSSQLPDVDYTDVTNKPSINSVTLSGNKTAADLGLVNNTDLTDIIATGPTNATGNTITSGLYFYLDGVLCKAKSDIANGATFTLNTNYEVVTAGGLNSLNSALDNFFDVVQTVQSFAAATSLSYTGKSITIPAKSFYSLMFNISYSNSLPQEICLSKSPTDVNPYNVFGRSSTALYLPLSGYTGNTPLTIYVWAKYATAATNNLYINGVTKTLG